MSTTGLSIIGRRSIDAGKVLFVIAVGLCIDTLAIPKKASFPDAVISAKSIAIVNETRDKALNGAASDAFTKWGRFKVIDSKDDADLIAVFTHKNGMGISGEVGFTEMEVFLKGSSTAVFQTKKAFRTVFDWQKRTEDCVGEFKKGLDRQP